MERKTDVIDIKVQSKDRLLPLLRGELRRAIAGALGAKVRLSERNRNVWAIQYPIALPVERVVTALKRLDLVVQIGEICERNEAGEWKDIQRPIR